MKIFCLYLQIRLCVFSKPLPTSTTKLKFEHNIDVWMTDNPLGPDDSPESTFNFIRFLIIIMRQLGWVEAGQDGTGLDDPPVFFWHSFWKEKRDTRSNDPFRLSNSTAWHQSRATESPSKAWCKTVVCKLMFVRREVCPVDDLFVCLFNIIVIFFMTRRLLCEQNFHRSHPYKSLFPNKGYS